jgi:hypothetical protein
MRFCVFPLIALTGLCSFNEDDYIDLSSENFFDLSNEDDDNWDRPDDELFDFMGDDEFDAAGILLGLVNAPEAIPTTTADPSDFETSEDIEALEGKGKKKRKQEDRTRTKKKKRAKKELSPQDETTLALLKFVKKYPNEPLDSLLAYIRAHIPDSDADLESLESDQAMIYAGAIVPGWIHHGLSQIYKNLQNSVASIQGIVGELLRIAPSDSVNALDPDLLKHVAETWIRYCVAPSVVNPDSAHQFCNKVPNALTNGFKTEYRTSYRLTDAQFAKYIDDQIALFTS